MHLTNEIKNHKQTNQKRTRKRIFTRQEKSKKEEQDSRKKNDNIAYENFEKQEIMKLKHNLQSNQSKTVVQKQHRKQCDKTLVKNSSREEIEGLSRL